MSDDNKTIPVGSIPPEPSKEPDTEPTPKEKKLYAGKYKTPEDLEKAYTEQAGKFGEHTNLVGELRKTNQAMEERLSAMEQSAKEREDAARKQEPPTNYEQELRDLATAYDKGDLSVEDFMLQSNALTRQQTIAEADAKYGNILEKAGEQFNQTLQERDQNQVVSKFHDDNPEFQQWIDSGEIDQVMSANPLHDQVSAFFELKAQRAFEEGKAEAARMEAGSKPAEQVLNKPGTSIQAKNDKPPGSYSKGELHDSMLKAALGG